MRIALFAAIALFTLTACTNPELTAAVEEARALSAQYEASLTAQKASLDEQKVVAAREVAAAKEDQDAAAIATTEAYLAELQKASAKVEALLARVTQANEVLSTPTKPDGSPDEAAMASTIGGLFGGPYGAAIGTGIGILLAGFSDWKRRQAKTDAVSIINGVSAVAANVPGFKDMLARGKPLLEKEYTDRAAALVKANKLATLPKVAA